MRLSHYRVIFPQWTDLPNVIRLDRDPDEPLVGKVWHKCIHWDGNQPAYDPRMDIHVGVEQPPEPDIFGRIVKPHARGLLRGEYMRFEQPVAGMPWGWLAFSLRYDIMEGPELWQGDWHQTMHEGEPGQAPFAYYYEINDSPE